MEENEKIDLRLAKNHSQLPEKLRKSYLLGAYQGNLYVGSEIGESSNDLIIFGYSVKEDSIIGSVKLKGSAYPTSWAQKNNFLYVGTRFGNIVTLDMTSCQEVCRSRHFGNSIDAIAVNGEVYFGVNGFGIHKSDVGLSGIEMVTRKNVVSALALKDDKVYSFYFSNGNDPLLDGSPSGGLIEVLDKNLNLLSERNGTPYAVTQAINSGEEIIISTADVSNGWIPQGSGELYELNQSDLSTRRLANFSSAVNVLRQGQGGAVLAGLKNGVTKAVKDKREITISSQEEEVTGIVVGKNEFYVGGPRGTILRVGN